MRRTILCAIARTALVLVAFAACGRGQAIARPEGEATAGSAPPAPAPDATGLAHDDCAGPWLSDSELQRAAPGKPIAIAELIASRPTSGLYAVEGYVQSPIHCDPCPPGEACKPCGDSVWLSDARGAYKDPLSSAFDLLIRVPDASRFAFASHYRMTVALCATRLPNEPLPVLALRGYAPLP